MGLRDTIYRWHPYLPTKGYVHGVSSVERRLICKANGKGSPPFDVDIELSQPDPTSLVIATPFDEHPSMFYYNHKINCMPASGVVHIGDKEFRFEPDTSFGLLDWGRGV